MKLGIIICDQVRQQLQPEFGDYPAMFANLLRQVDDQLELEFFSAINLELPDDIDACDGYLISGSRWGVNDDLAWIRQLEQFIQQLYLANKGLVGICFGHQLIGKALGGLVEKSAKGRGVGVALNQVSQLQPWMIPVQNRLNLVVSHQDQIIDPPPHTRVLLGNEFCPYAMIQVGAHTLGIQGHPEFSRQYSQALINCRKEQLGASVVAIASHSLSHQVDDVVAMTWLINFLKQS